MEKNLVHLFTIHLYTHHLLRSLNNGSGPARGIGWVGAWKYREEGLMGKKDGGRERIFFSVPLFPRNKPASPSRGQRSGRHGFIHYCESRVILSHWLYFQCLLAMCVWPLVLYQAYWSFLETSTGELFQNKETIRGSHGAVSSPGLLIYSWETDCRGTEGRD